MQFHNSGSQGSGLSLETVKCVVEDGMSMMIVHVGSSRSQAKFLMNEVSHFVVLA